MMDPVERLLELRKRAERLSRDHARAEGACEEIAKRIRARGCDDLEALEAKVKKDRKELARLEKELAAGVSMFEEEWGSKLEET